MPRSQRRRVLVALPTAWDGKQLAACRAAWEERFEIVFGEPDDESCRADLDPAAWVEGYAAAAERGDGLDGVFSSSDYPGATLAAALATRLGLPGPDPATVLRCSHKYYSRLAQREAAPEATPGFWPVDARRPGELPEGLPFPCFVKPVKGAYSLLARKVDSPAELAAFLARPEVKEYVGGYLRLFDRLVAVYTGFELDGGFFLAEELLSGEQVTVEAWSRAGEVAVLGVVDSALHPLTKSFLRFDYPSRLPAEVQERMAGIVRRVIAGLGLVDSMFNVEMIWDPQSGRVSVIEVNPRMCGQFADLYRKVDGTSGYEVALALAVGETPRIERGGGRHALAASFPLRVFEGVRVARAPGADDVAAAEALYPDALVWNECSSGQELTDFLAFEDGRSARYGVLDLGGPGREELIARSRRVLDRLGYRFEPAAPPRPRDFR